MIKIVVGGQIDKEFVASIARKAAGENAVVEVKGDIEAAMAVKTGQADYYLGACNTGGGGALAMAIALLGLTQCATVSMPGKIKSNEEIIQEVKAGKKAFGFTPQHAEAVVPVIINTIING